MTRQRKRRQGLTILIGACTVCIVLGCVEEDAQEAKLLPTSPLWFNGSMGATLPVPKGSFYDLGGAVGVSGEYLGSGPGGPKLITENVAAIGQGVGVSPAALGSGGP